MIRLALFVVRWLLLFYPRRFRHRHGAELRRIYSERLRRRPLRALRAAVLETLRDAPGAHLDERSRRRALSSGLGSREAILPTALELRQTVRSLVRRPAFSLVVILVLALGIGANTAIFSLVRGVMLSPLPFPEADRLVRIWGTYEGRLSTGGTLSYPDILDMEDRCRSLDGVAAYDEWVATLTGDGTPLRLDAAQVSASYFEVLGVQPALGRLFLADDDIDGQDRVVVLHHEFWQSRYGGDRSVIGRTAVLNGHAHEIIGVAPPEFEDPDLSDGDPPPQLWRPLGLIGAPEDDMPLRGSSSFVAVARLAPGVEFDTAQAELATLMSQLEDQYPDSNHDRNAALVSLQEQLLGDADQSLLLLLGAVGFLLAIAVANVTSMMLGRAAERAGDSALRRALGAGRLALLRHGMLEGILLALAGGAAGVGLAHVLVRVVLDLAGPSLPRADQVRVDGPVLLFAVTISVLVSLACGLIPSLKAGLGRHVRLVAGGPRSVGSVGVLRLRGVLVTLQIAMALVLLHGATLLGSSFLRLQQVDIGVQPAGLVTFDLALPWSRFEEVEQRNAYYREVLERLDALPGVEHASSTNILPLSGSFDGMPVKVPSKLSPDPDGAWSAQTRSVSADFFETAGVPILRGRSITESDGFGSPPVAVVNQAFADFFWPDAEPLGARIQMMGEEIEVVGIAADTKHMKLVEEPVRHLYLAREQAVVFWQGYWQTVLLRVAGDHHRIGELPDAIRQAVWQVDADIPIANLQSMEQVVDGSVQSPRLRATLLVAFAALALLLGAVGVYGVSSYGIAIERRALAVRMALGADGGDITRHVLRRVAVWATVGSACGLAGAWALGRTVERFLYGVEPLSPLLLGAVGVLLLVALVSAWAPARNAVGIDPASTLRA